jgi:UDP-N-acetylglucosamine 2-epimerase (non-hydrolysing)
MIRVLCVLGTRPEALKMTPVIEALPAFGCLPIVLSTGQHGSLLERPLADAGIIPDETLPVLSSSRDIAELTGALVPGVFAAIHRLKPDAVLGQGDTVTAFAAGLAAYYASVAFGHVEAGLRTSSLSAPHPEEGLRRLAAVVSRWHFAPTERARQELLREGYDPASIHLVGNTVIDSLERAIRRGPAWPASVRPVRHGERLALVTLHRRENHGEPMARILGALRDFALARPEARLVVPIHPNPASSGPTRRALAGLPNVELIDPLDHSELGALLQAAFVVLTDSGGIQEEASWLGKPLLLFREETERSEVVEAGGAVLVGSDPALFRRELERLFTDPIAHAAMARPRQLFGDGKAAERIAAVVAEAFPARAGIVTAATPATSEEQRPGPPGAQAVAGWLFSPAVQVEEGEHQGAVVGWHDDAGRPAFLYPEIAGYYLSALAFAAVTLPDFEEEACERAGLTAAWLLRQAGGGAPLARVPFSEPADFRSSASFAFDLGMCLRGVDAAAPLLGNDHGPVREALLAHLARHLSGGELVAALPGPGITLPRRWSTEGGPYHLKVAAGLLSGRPVPAPLAQVGRALVERWSGAPHAGGPELHPLLYGLEGKLLMGLHGNEPFLRDARAGLDLVLSLQRADGTLPALLDDPAGPTRSDIMAQAIRLGSALHLAGVTLPDGTLGALRRLRGALLFHLAPSGAVCFAPPAASPRHWNVWAGVFTFQALLLHDRLEAGEPVDRQVLGLLA